MDLVEQGLTQGRINHLGPHPNVRRGAFSHTRSHGFSLVSVIFFSWECTFLPPESDDLF